VIIAIWILIISFLLTNGREKVNNNEIFWEIKSQAFLRGFGCERKWRIFIVYLKTAKF